MKKMDESSKSEQQDYDEEFEDDEESEDYEGTLDEEELLSNEEDEEELGLLQQESEMSVEELRKKYYGDAAPRSPAKLLADLLQFSPDEDDDPNVPGPSSRCQPRAPSNLRPSLLTSLYNEPDLEDDDSNDKDYLAKSFLPIPVSIGPEHQIADEDLPVCHSNTDDILSSSSDSLSSYIGHEARPLWIPNPSKCSDETINEYLHYCETTRRNRLPIPLINFKRKVNQNPGFMFGSQKKKARQKQLSTVTYNKDDETALYKLFQNNYDVTASKNCAPFPWHLTSTMNGPRLTYQQPWRDFTEADMTRFEEGFYRYGDDFNMIRAEFLRDRTVGELVTFYYAWLHTERHDMFYQRVRLDCVRRNVQPPAHFDFTESCDPMDVFIDEYNAEQAALNRADNKESPATGADDNESPATGADDKESPVTGVDDNESPASGADNNESPAASADDNQSSTNGAYDNRSIATSAYDVASVAGSSSSEKKDDTSGADEEDRNNNSSNEGSNDNDGSASGSHDDNQNDDVISGNNN